MLPCDRVHVALAVVVWTASVDALSARPARMSGARRQDSREGAVMTETPALAGMFDQMLTMLVSAEWLTEDARKVAELCGGAPLELEAHFGTAGSAGDPARWFDLIGAHA
jgi:hypothetical protein